MQKYVLGFLFDDRYENLVMIEKQKPAWQAGLLNVPGGKVKPFEFDLQAIEREFLEETGCYIQGQYWERFYTAVGDDYTLTCFVCCSQERYEQAKTREAEEIIKVPVADIEGLIFKNKAVSNLLEIMVNLRRTHKINGF